MFKQQSRIEINEAKQQVLIEKQKYKEFTTETSHAKSNSLEVQTLEDKFKEEKTSLIMEKQEIESALIKSQDDL